MKAFATSVVAAVNARAQGMHPMIQVIKVLDIFSWLTLIRTRRENYLKCGR